MPGRGTTPGRWNVRSGLLIWLVLVLVLILALAAIPGTRAAERPAGTPLRAVATFSILADLVRQVGGDRVAVSSLVGPEADAHGYSPAPGDARRLAEADVVFVNGLGLEGWIDRLIAASGTRARVVVASKGVTTIPARADHDHGHDGPGHDGPGHGGPGHGGPGHGGPGHSVDASAPPDPHAWQSVPNVRIYVANIRDGLTAADPGGAAAYARAADAYLAELERLDAQVRAGVQAIPPERRRIITTHDAFGYFSAAYGIGFLAPQGVSTSSEASPRDVARIIRQIRRDRVPAVFLETVADPRLMEQIARESGARVGGRVYSDALSRPDGPAPTYLDMMRANLRAFGDALAPG